MYVWCVHDCGVCVSVLVCAYVRGGACAHACPSVKKPAETTKGVGSPRVRVTGRYGTPDMGF